LRKNTKAILWFTIAAFVGFIFLAWGMQMRMGSSRPRNLVGKVNGRKITYSEYQREFESMASDFRRTKGREPSWAETQTIQQQAWENLVNRILLSQEARRRGIIVTPGEIVQTIRANPPSFLYNNPGFQTDGQFDYQKYLQALDNPGVDWSPLENMVRETLPLNKLTTRVLAMAMVSEGEVRSEYERLHEKVDVSCLFLDPSAQQVDSSEVSEERLREYYRTHESEFRIPEQIKVRYCLIERAPSEADELEVKDRLESIREDAVSGTDFAELARTFSDAPSAAEGGKMGEWLARASLPRAVYEKLSQLEPGQVSAVFRDASGYRIVKMEGKRKKKGREEFQLREIVMDVSPGAETVDSLRTLVRDLYDRSKKDGLATAALALGLPTRESNFLAKGQAPPELYEIREHLERLFAKNPGELLPVQETSAGWVLAELAEKNPQKLAPFEKVKQSVRDKLVEEVRREKTRALGNEILSDLRSGKTMEKVAEKWGVPLKNPEPFTRTDVVPLWGDEPELVGTCFGMETGDTSDLIPTKRGYYIVRVNKTIGFAEKDYEKDKDQLRENILRAKQSLILRQWLTSLRDQAKISDYRQQFYF